jgi:hypothetical protein
MTEDTFSLYTAVILNSTFSSCVVYIQRERELEISFAKTTAKKESK